MGIKMHKNVEMFQRLKLFRYQLKHFKAQSNILCNFRKEFSIFSCSRLLTVKRFVRRCNFDSVFGIGGRSVYGLSNTFFRYLVQSFNGKSNKKLDRKTFHISSNLLLHVSSIKATHNGFNCQKNSKLLINLH